MATFESFDGLTLSYTDEGDGRAVVLLHGFAADTNVNYVRSGILDLLLDEGYRVDHARRPRSRPVVEADRPRGVRRRRDEARRRSRCSTTWVSTTCCSSGTRWARTSRCGSRPTNRA